MSMRQYLPRWITLCLLALLWFLPLVSLILFSFAPPAEVMRGGFVPSQWTLDNYAAVMTDTTRGVSVPKRYGTARSSCCCRS